MDKCSGEQSSPLPPPSNVLSYGGLRTARKQNVGAFYGELWCSLRQPLVRSKATFSTVYQHKRQPLVRSTTTFGAAYDDLWCSLRRPLVQPTTTFGAVYQHKRQPLVRSTATLFSLIGLRMAHLCTIIYSTFYLRRSADRQEPGVRMIVSASRMDLIFLFFVEASRLYYWVWREPKASRQRESPVLSPL